MKRIFTAIDISDAARAKAAGYIKHLRGAFPHLRVGWDKPEKLHLTLKFLGDINDRELQSLTEAVETSARKISNFKLRIMETGAFPTERKARVLWLGVRDENENLQNLNEILEGECERFGFAGEKRNFKAHLTIARLREPDKAKELIERHLENKFESAEFNVTEITIYESRLQKSGSIYSIVSKFKLKEI